MPAGAGKYDDVCSVVRSLTLAEGAVVIVFDGVRGTGFSVQASLEVLARMPAILEAVAAEIRASSPPNPGVMQ